jgi:hypothetical protein
MQNFGKIKNAFNGILAEGLVSKNEANKLLFKKYIKTIKESEILRTQFLVYNNIENKLESDSLSANLYVSENLSLLAKYKISDIIKENKKLIALSEQVSANLEESYDPTLSALHESLSNLIFTKKTPNSIDSVTDSAKSVVEYIKANKAKDITESIELPNSMISIIMVDKYNEKYADLDETEKKILKSLIDADDNQKKDVYESTLKECLALVNEKLTGSDLETKDRLLRVKEKLLNDKQEITEDFFANISKLVELKTNLKDN